MNDPLNRGYTVADLAARFRVSPDEVRGWMRRGELAAINTSSELCGRAAEGINCAACEIDAFAKCKSESPSAYFFWTIMNR